MEHRLRRTVPDHLGQLVHDPELQREPVAGAGPQPQVLGHARQAGQDRVPASSPTTPSWCRPSRTRRSTLQPVDGEFVDRPECGPGPEHRPRVTAARPRVRALRLQPGRPVPGQAPGPRGHRPRGQPPGDHLPHRGRDLLGHHPARQPDVREHPAPVREQRGQPTPPSTRPRRSRCSSGLGFKKASDGYYQPNYGPQAGPGPDVHHPVDVGQRIRAPQTEQLFQAQMKAIGIKINIQNYDANTFFGTNLPDRGSTRSASSPGCRRRSSRATSRSTARTPARSCGQNWTHSANPRSTLADGRLGGSAAPTPRRRPRTTTRPTRSCGRTWPRCRSYQKPQFLAWSNTLKGRAPQHLERRRHLERRDLWGISGQS